MTTTNNKPITRLLGLLNKHRKYVWIAVIIASYALLGFFLAPWLVKKYAVEAYGKMYAAELRMNKVDINPFVLSLRIVELELLDPAGDPVVRAGEIFVNFQLSSLFRWAWTFDEFKVTRPELFVARDKSGDLNFAYLTAGGPSGPTAVGGSSGPTPMTRMMIFAFEISDGAVNWRDEVPVDLVDTRFGPINIEIQELNTLPQRSGHQTVLITTETSGTLSWTGSLELNPLKSAAHASIKGSHFPLASAYLRHESGFDIVDGNVDVELDYTVDTLADGSLAATVDNFNLAFNDVIVHTFSGAPTADDSGDMYADQRRAVLEQLFMEQAQAGETDMSLTLQDLRARFTSQVENEEGLETLFDKLAYANELNRQLVDLQALTDAELIVLATQRKENTRAAILANDESLAVRITLSSNQAVEKRPDENIQMKVTLSVGSKSNGVNDEA